MTTQTDTLHIEEWIDKLCDVWAFETENMKTVRSFRLIGEPKIPSALTPANDYPCAVTIPSDVQTGTDGVNIYSGITNFFVTPNKDMAHIPSMMKWYRLIHDAWLNAGLTLGGAPSVEHFGLVADRPAIVGPIELNYSEGSSPCWGFSVEWIVKERVASTIVP